MTGVTWFVQIVHYPLMSAVGSERFPFYETAHSRLTSFVVIAPMTLELVLAVALLIRRPDSVGMNAAAIGAALVAVIWLSTFLLQVPQHDTLSHGFSTTAHQRLVRTNWIRTIAWTLRSVLVVWMLR